MKKVTFYIYIIFVFFACNSGDDNVAEDNPTVVDLIFPFENSECIGGTDTTETESTILFEWSASLYADDYELNIKNLATSDSTSHNTTDLSVSVTLKRSTPYAWYVIAKSNSVDASAKSAIWRFYNAGEALIHHVPFPAEIVSPAMAEHITPAASTISLQWIGSDIDNDIVGYDIYFGTTSPPDKIETDFTETILNELSILANTIYYWKIVTKDAQGNSSDSDVYQFKIN